VNGTTHTTKRLYRCREDRQIAGIAGGMAEYLEIDPTVVRILWILAFLMGGFGLLLYVILAFVVPLEPVGYGMPSGFGTTGTGTTWTGTSTAGAEGPAEAEILEGAPAGVAEGIGSPAGVGGAAPVHGHGYAYAPGNDGWHADRRAKRERSGNVTMAFGVLLVVFGAIALMGPVFPGWITGAALGPAFVVALGIALLVGALRRPATDR